MEIGDTECAIATATSAGDGEVEVVSKRRLKKMRRAERDPVERQAKKRKSKQEAKSAAKFQAEVPTYSFVNGYRTVEPYVYEFRTFAKARWFNRELLEVFTTEFGANSPEYYRFAIASGRISVNHQLVPTDTVIKNGDLIIHTAHRHEPPVSGDEVAVVYENDDLIAVSKPPSMPTHPCGAYRHNSLHSILQTTRPDLPQLHVVHRLDRLTSGVVLLAKNAAKAKSLSSIIANRQASKTYLARVRGDFPALFDQATQETLVSKARVNCPASVITFPEKDTLVISCPLRCLSARDGVWECHENGKASETLVRLVRADKSTSLVKCQPVTGRTHQIRLHLQLVGFPIANDPCYGGELHFGERVQSASKRLQRRSAAKLILCQKTLWTIHRLGRRTRARRSS
uniref:Pseudouridine synthase RsuA/RluA-like domain-containing protein n=1 Tax=Peronospora matthiolae TaxID=2874970 RepID=A0AAV1UJ64_9STRA